MNKELLMTYDEYNTIEHEEPYTYILNKNNQYLYYFGSRHSFDPKDTQFETIEKFWIDFTEKTNGQKSIVFLEGRNRPALETKEKAILEGGEMHFVAYLAKQQGIKTFSPEPPDKLQFEKALEHFSKEEIGYYFFARVCYQWNRMIDKPDFDIYINRFLVRDARGSGWVDFDFSIKHFSDIHKKIFNTDFNKDDKDFFYSIINPTTEKSIINKVSKFIGSELRDIHILEEIEKVWKDGFSLFIIYGSTHAVTQEPVLRDLIEKQ